MIPSEDRVQHALDLLRAEAMSLKAKANAEPKGSLDALEWRVRCIALLDASNIVSRTVFGNFEDILKDALKTAKPDPEIPGIGPAERMAIADYAKQKGE
jgi:hypothetical protein